MTMFHSHSGVFFDQVEGGAVKVTVKESAHDNAKILKEVVFDADTWASIIANMSYYGEEDYGYYRALNFHSKTPIHETTPLKDKPSKW